MNEYDAYLFDGDGTLYDTADMIYRCFQDICQKFRGFDIEKKRVYDTIGLPFDQQLNDFIGPLADGEYDEIMISYRAFQENIFKDSVKLFPEIKETLAELKSRGKKMAVVTSRKLPSVTKYLKYTDIFSYFDVLITPESTLKHKPNPEPAFEALKQLDINAKDALFVGDAIFDIECGRGAGVDTAYVNWSFADNHPDNINATYYLNGIRDILKW